MQIPDLIAIPKIFQADATGGYFEKCISCECSLLNDQVDYLIEKAFKAYDGLNNYATIFEYAMCWSCTEKMRQTLSIQSRTNISRFFERYTDLEGRRQQFREKSSDINQWLGRCAVSHVQAHDLKEFQIYGHCQGSDLILHHYPFMVSGQVMDDLIQLISNKTLDDLQNFTDELIGGPPEFADLLKTGPRVFI